MGFSLLFLGTCAHEYSPRLESELKDCFDKDARRSSSALLDGRYLIDCGDHCLDEVDLSGAKVSTHEKTDKESKALFEMFLISSSILIDSASFLRFDSYRRFCA